ncbi:MAG: YdcF family protein [Actinomycetota bacterium]
MTEARASRARPWWSAVVVFAAAGTVAASFWRWVVRAPNTPVGQVAPADAVVIFVGGRGERLERARELLEVGVATRLVVPNGTAVEDPELRDFCRQRHPFEVICPAVTSHDTGGEAQAIAALATEQGWRRLVMVTSGYHLGRARLRLARCFDGEIQAVGTEHHLPPLILARTMAREWLGHIEARTVERSC